jgi:hypothetical protein
MANPVTSAGLSDSRARRAYWIPRIVHDVAYSRSVAFCFGRHAMPLQWRAIPGPRRSPARQGELRGRICPVSRAASAARATSREVTDAFSNRFLLVRPTAH